MKNRYANASPKQGEGVFDAIPFGQPGGVDDVTGRMGLTIEQWQKIDDPDLPVYWHIKDSMCGEDWAYVDGIDMNTDGLSADVWFESGNCKTVPIQTVVYMARKHAEPLLPRALRENLTAAAMSGGVLEVMGHMADLLEMVEEKVAANDLREARDTVAEYERGLSAIAGGHIPGLINLVLAGNWQGAFELLQGNARAVLECAN